MNPHIKVLQKRAANLEAWIRDANNADVSEVAQRWEEEYAALNWALWKLKKAGVE